MLDLLGLKQEELHLLLHQYRDYQGEEVEWDDLRGRLPRRLLRRRLVHLQEVLTRVFDMLRAKELHYVRHISDEFVQEFLPRMVL